MEVGVPNSFIPHDATTPTQSAKYYSGGGLGDLLALIAIVVFVASLALLAGSYFYLQYLNNVSASKQAAIKQAESAFDPALIQQLSDLDARMNAAQTILSAHLAPSSFFSALDQTTLQTVSLGGLTLDASNPKNIQLKMSGVAHDVNGIALQADLFSKGGIITNPIFSGINQQSDGVHFDMIASVNTAALNYQTLVSGQTATGVNQIPTINATTSANSGSSAPAASFTATSTPNGATPPTK